MKWKYVKKLEDISELKNFEFENSCKLPVDLEKCVVCNNGGRPEKKVFDTDKSEGRMIKRLLSFNYGEVENIWDAFNVMQKEASGLVPFAVDPGGNYICFQKNDHKIYLWLHETNTTEYVAESFKDFLNKLK